MTSTNSELIVLDQANGRRIFAGIIKEVTKKFYKTDGYTEECLVQDYSRLIDDVGDGVTKSYSSQTEKAILQDLFSTYCSDIIVGADVIQGSSTSIDYENDSLRRAIDALADQNSRKWYVDYHKNFHYFTLGDKTAPFGLSDSPDEVSTFKYGLDMEYTEDIVDSEKRGKLTCWRDGLFSGQVIQITNSKLSWSAEEFLIYEVEAIPIAKESGDMVMQYRITFGGKPERITRRIADSDTELAGVQTLAVPKTILISVPGTLYTGSNVTYEVPIPFTDGFTCTTVYINVKTAPTGQAVIVDVNLDGSTIFSTQANRPQIAAGSTTGESGAPDTQSMTQNQIVSIDTDQVGSGTAGANMVVELRGFTIVDYSEVA